MRILTRRSFAPFLSALLFFAACRSAPPPRPDSAVSTADAELAAAVDALATEHASRDVFSGVVILARNDRPILAKAYGLADRDVRRANTMETRLNIASLGKMFTAVAIGQLVERGVLSYDAPVGTYLKNFPNVAIAEKVTIHHLLTHTSGIPDLPESLFIAPPRELAGYLPFFQGAQLEFAPGSKRSYSNSGFVLLGLILEQVTEQPFESVLRRNVFTPAGMSSVVFRREDAASTAIGYTRKSDTDAWQPNTELIAARGGPHGGALVSGHDLVRFFHALRNGQLLKRESAQMMITPRNGAANAYGFGTLDFDTDRLVGHSGGDVGASADAYTYWKSGYTVVVLSNLGPPASHEIARATRKLLEPRFKTPAEGKP